MDATCAAGGRRYESSDSRDSAWQRPCFLAVGQEPTSALVPEIVPVQVDLPQLLPVHSAALLRAYPSETAAAARRYTTYGGVLKQPDKHKVSTFAESCNEQVARECRQMPVFPGGPRLASVALSLAPEFSAVSNAPRLEKAAVHGASGL